MKIKRTVFSLFSCCFALQAATAYAAGINAQLLEAAREGQLATVQQLITDGADVNTFANNESPLYIATARNHTEIMRTLLAGGADVETLTNGERPLHVAAGENHVEAIQVLLEANANVDGERFSEKGCTSLQVAAYCGRIEAIRELLLAGATIDVEYRHDTPLGWAMIRDHINTALEFVRRGADLERVKHLALFKRRYLREAFEALAEQRVNAISEVLRELPNDIVYSVLLELMPLPGSQKELLRAARANRSINGTNRAQHD